MIIITLAGNSLRCISHVGLVLLQLVVEPALYVMFAQGFDNAIDITFDDLVEAVEREVDPVVSQSVLGEVVCADPIAPVA
jgi:hypothetical protein